MEHGVLRFAQQHLDSHVLYGAEGGEGTAAPKDLPAGSTVSWGCHTIFPWCINSREIRYEGISLLRNTPALLSSGAQELIRAASGILPIPSLP